MTDSMIITLVGFIATFIAAITPIFKLNNSITKLNATIDNLYEEVVQSKKHIEKLKEKNQEQEIRIVKLEERKQYVRKNEKINGC